MADNNWVIHPLQGINANFRQVAESREMWMEAAERWKGQAEKYRAVMERIADTVHPQEYAVSEEVRIAREALS